MNQDSRILILMSDNRDLSSNLNESDYNSLATYINYKYSEKFGYDFKYLQPRIDGENTIFNCFSPTNKIRHASWSKLLSVKKILKEHPEYDWILYIDSDCIFKDDSRSLFKYLSDAKTLDNKNLNFDRDLIFMNNQPYNVDKPCAGFFIIRNTNTALNFLDYWYSDEEEDWCNTIHPWEQTPLQYRLKFEFEMINDWMFFEKPSQFLRHIGTAEDFNRIPYFRSMIKDSEDFARTMNEISKQIIRYNTKYS